MKQKKSSECTYMLILMIFVVFAMFMLSCKNTESRFSTTLTKIDSLIKNGETKKALVELSNLKKSAQTSSNWLSIAKRQRAMHEYGFAAETLRIAHVELPANEMVIAVLIDSLYRNKEHLEAAIMAEQIQNTSFALIGSSAIIHSYLGGYIENALPVWWHKAFLGGAGSLFGRNAAVFYAAQADFLNAANVYDLSNVNNQDDRLFYSLILYQASLYDRASQILSQPADSKLSGPELLLYADISLHKKEPDTAINYWNECISRFPLISPVPFYNVAVHAKSVQTYLFSLKSCLEYFPSYTPAIIRYARVDQLSDSFTSFNYVQQTLSDLGIYSLEMERIIDTFLPSSKEIDNVFQTALQEKNNDDIRLLLEYFRFQNLSETHQVRATALLWALLEKFPNEKPPLLYDYAVWFFANRGEYDISYNLNNQKMFPDPFYVGMELTGKGDIENAEIFFQKSLENTALWSAIANLGVVSKKKKDYSHAIECFSQAAQLSADSKIKSKMHYETAVCLVAMKLFQRAHTILGYSLELNPYNYQAASLRVSLENR